MMPRMAWVMVWGLLAAAAVYGEPPAAGTPSPALEDAWSVVEPKPAPAHPPAATPPTAKDDGQLLRRSSGRGSGSVLKPRAARGGASWLRTIGAMAGVVGLIVFLAWGYRAVAAGNLGLFGRPRRPGVIEIVSTAAISPRQALYLVRIGPRMVLIGQGQDGLRALDVIDDADLTAQLAGQAVSQRGGGSVAAFREALESEAREYDAPVRPRERVGTREPSLDELRQNVLATIERLRRASADR